VSDRLVFLEKHYLFRHGGLRLHPSELHLLLAIRGEPQATPRGWLRVSASPRAAVVSRFMKRLKGKGVIASTPIPRRRTR